MKILVAHNYYQRRGGEDAVCESEITLLRQAGHEVIEYLRRNDEIRDYSFFEKANLGWSASWSERTNRALSQHAPSYFSVRLLRLPRGGSARDPDAS